MDFDFGEEQKMLKTLVKDFVSTEFTFENLRSIEEKGLKAFLPVYKRMADIGLLGIRIPEEYGGYGGSWMDIAILSEGLGYALAPTVNINSVILGGHAILAFGDEKQKRDLLPQLTTGKRIISVAWLERNADLRLPDFHSRLTEEPNGFVISGHKQFVNHTDIATDFLVLLRSIDGDFALAAVDSKKQGIINRLRSIQSGECIAEVEFKSVSVNPQSCMLGQWSAWLSLMDGAKIALAAYCAGAAQGALDMSVEYAKNRVQFGRPIGSFQSIQEKLADVAVEVEHSKIMSYYTAWLRDNGQDCAEEAAMANLLAGQALQRAATAGVLVHGCYGFSLESDVQFYFRRAKVLQQQLETSRTQKEIIAESFSIHN